MAIIPFKYSPSVCARVARSAAMVVAFLPAMNLIISPDLRADDVPGEYTAIRSIGMGDATTPLANDESSIWTNPAGIGRARKARSRDVFSVTKTPNVLVGANSNGRSFYKAFRGSKDTGVAGVLEGASNLSDKPLWARASAFPVALFDASRNAPMAVGVFSNTTVKAVVSSDVPEQARVTAISDVGATATFGWTNDSNRFNVGLGVRPIMRYAFEDIIPSNDLVNRSAMQGHLKDESNRSQGTGVDFGALYTVADFWYPTIGLAILNLPTGCKANYLNPYDLKRETVCGNVYTGSFANPDALSTVDPTDLRVGMSITPRLSRSVGVRFSVDAHHIPVGTASQSYGLLGMEVSKMIHGGIEVFTGNPLTVSPFAVRAGFNQGFATAGATASLGFMTIEFATYGADISTTAKPIEDRRYLGSFTFDL